MDDFDIYDDLQLLQEHGKQKAEEESEWKQKYDTALGTIEKLQSEKKDLSKKIKTLETNFVSLLETARAEIKRKDCQIAELRKEKDDICFRRVIHKGYKHFNNDNIPPVSIREHVNQAESAHPTKCSVGYEGRKGNRNPIQKETSDGFKTSSEKPEKEGHKSKFQKTLHNENINSICLNRDQVSKQEFSKQNSNERILKSSVSNSKCENLAATTQNEETYKSKKHIKCEKLMEDLKEFKKRKQSDLKNDSVTESKLALKAVNEKLMLFDALFDDLNMNKEKSEDSYSNIDRCSVARTVSTSKLPNAGNPLYDLPIGNDMGSSTEQVKTNKVDQNGIPNIQKKHEILNKISTSEPIVLIEEKLTKTYLSKVTSSTKSPIEERLNAIEKEDTWLREKHRMISNSNKMSSNAGEILKEFVHKTPNLHKQDLTCEKIKHRSSKIEKTQSIGREDKEKILKESLYMSEEEKDENDVVNDRKRNESLNNKQAELFIDQLSEKTPSTVDGEYTTENNSIQTYPVVKFEEPRIVHNFAMKTHKQSKDAEDIKDKHSSNDTPEPVANGNNRDLHGIATNSESKTRHMFPANHVKNVESVKQTADAHFTDENKVKEVYFLRNTDIDIIKNKIDKDNECDVDSTLLPSKNDKNKGNSLSKNDINIQSINTSNQCLIKPNSSNSKELESQLALEKKQSVGHGIYVPTVLHYENRTQSNLKLNKADKDCNISENEKVFHPSDRDLRVSKKQDASIKKSFPDCQSNTNQIHQSNNPFDEIKSPKEATVEDDIEETQYTKMPPLLVEDEPEEVTSKEKFPNTIMNSKVNDISDQNSLTTENRIHHKKRMLQSSRKTENTKNSLCIQSVINSPSALSSAYEQIVKKSIPSKATTFSENINDEDLKKTDLHLLNSYAKQSPLKRLLLPKESKENMTKPIEKFDKMERYKKKILQKYENSTKVVEKKDENLSTTSSNTNTNSPIRLLSTNGNNTHTQLDSFEIKVNKDSRLTVLSNSVSIETTDVICKSNLLEICEKRKSPVTIEPETSSCKALNSHKNVGNESTLDTTVCKNPQINIYGNINTTDLSVDEIVEVSKYIDISSKNGTNRQQSNEVSSQGVIINENNLKRPDCEGKSTIANAAGVSPIKECQNVPHLKLNSKLVNTPKEKTIKRKFSSDLSEQKDDEKISKTKRSKKNDFKSPDMFKLLPSDKKQDKQTENGSKTNHSVEKALVCEVNCNIIDQNIFTNDDCPNDSNFPVVCNDNDIQYQEIDNRLRSMFQSPTYNSPTIESMIDSKCDNIEERNYHIALNHTVNENEKLQCDTSSSSRKISVGSNDYVIETVDAHVANVFVTRKKCKKRTKLPGAKF